MKTILHVGPHKTGTTSLQYFLRDNGPKLAAQGAYVPNIPALDGTPNQWWLVYIAAKSDEQATKYHNSIRGGHTAERCRELRLQYQEKLNQAIAYYQELEAKQGREGKLIISTEEVAFLDRGEMNGLYRMLLEKSTAVEVIYYYRSPIDRLRSDLQQGSKGGHVAQRSLLQNLPCQDTARMKKFLPDDEIQDKVVITVRPYKRGLQGNKDWDIRLDFCEAAEINPEQLQVLTDDPGANSNMSLQMFAILQRANKMMPATVNSRTYNKLRRWFHEAVEKYKWTPEDKPFLFSAQDVSDLLGSQESMRHFLDIWQINKSVRIHPDCMKVFDSLSKTPVAAEIEGSTLEYNPRLSADYVANLLCHFWSFLMYVGFLSRTNSGDQQKTL